VFVHIFRGRACRLTTLMKTRRLNTTLSRTAANSAENLKSPNHFTI
jgi:hypothetical protein